MKLLFSLVLALTAFIAAQPAVAQSYATEIQNSRKQKDATFRKGEKSPILPKKQKKFRGLHYFPVDSNYKVEATFVRASSQAPFKMKTSTGRLPEYIKYGELHFSLAGKPYVLTVYQNLELVQKPEYKDYLFIPFMDETNGFDTYGGGRYLDFRIPAADTVTLDFNMAYNPYCAYSPAYSCPIPPVENHLKVKIEAGEKSYK
jgi:uncharacterized protein (DUF1684 family)